MKIRLIVKHAFKPKNPKRKIVKNVTYHANADGTVTTSTSKKIIDLPDMDSQQTGSSQTVQAKAVN